MVLVPSDGPRSRGAGEALSRQRIVDVAVDLLDEGGERALTYRALTARLDTGTGAIYWHMANKDELLATATGQIVDRALSPVPGVTPEEAIRRLALELFDTIDARPWVGGQLSRAPWQPAILLIFERLGGRLEAMGVAEGDQFDTASALLLYILGVAGQNAANARAASEDSAMDRASVLRSAADRWSELDPSIHPFLHRIATQLRDHDDRAQFAAGVDLILAGIAAGAAPLRRGRAAS